MRSTGPLSPNFGSAALVKAVTVLGERGAAFSDLTGLRVASSTPGKRSGTNEAKPWRQLFDLWSITALLSYLLWDTTDDQICYGCLSSLDSSLRRVELDSFFIPVLTDTSPGVRK